MKTVSSDLEEAKLDRGENTERDKLADQQEHLQLERDNLLKECKEYQNNDPRAVLKMKGQLEVAYSDCLFLTLTIWFQDLKQGVNRWTDNVFAVKCWCRNKFNYEDSVLDKQFGIPSDFDYI